MGFLELLAVSLAVSLSRLGSVWLDLRAWFFQAFFGRGARRLSLREARSAESRAGAALDLHPFRDSARTNYDGRAARQ